MQGEILLLTMCVLILIGWVVTYDRLQKSITDEREQWAKERKDLMDRVQAPSFQEYAAKVIKEKKLEKPEEEEQKIEFVS